MVYFIPMYSLSGPNRIGLYSDWVGVGTAIYMAIVIVVNLKIALITRCVCVCGGGGGAPGRPHQLVRGAGGCRFCVWCVGGGGPPGRRHQQVRGRGVSLEALPPALLHGASRTPLRCPRP